MTAMAVFASGCAVSQKHVVPAAQVRPELEATKEQLLARYNHEARAIQTFNATVDLLFTAGSTYTGVIEEYHNVHGFILAQRPASIRVIGQAPVVAKNVFDMVSDGETFRIFIPSKNKFIVGPTNLQRPAKKPIENLRPQHLLDALFWPAIPANAPVLFEEVNQPDAWYYVLTLLQETGGSEKGPNGWEIARKIWFRRSDLSVSLIQIYGPEGQLISHIGYHPWDLVEGGGGTRFPTWFTILRWRDSYGLKVTITKLAVNEPIAAERFRLDQPPGTELVRLGEGAEEPKP